MRILSITAQKPDSTGSGVYLAQMVKALSALGHEQAVVFGMAPEDTPALAAGVTRFPVHFETDELPFKMAGMSDVMPYPATRYRDFTPQMLTSFKSAFEQTIARAIQEFAPDLIITHHLYIVSALAARLAKDIPTAAICHGTCLRQLESHDLDAAFIKEGIAQVDRVFALTGPQVTRISRDLDLPEQMISVLGTGFNSHEFFPKPELAGSKPEPHAKAALYVGKICSKKGVPNLIGSLELLSFNPEDFQLRIVGGTEDEECLCGVSRQAEESRYKVELLGKVSQPDLVREYQGADIFILPSFYEGLPLVIIEAMASGAVAVCTDLPGIKDWIDDVAPDAPIVFVKPPRMLNVDEPLEGDLPAFEARLAQAIEAAALMKGNPGSVAQLSWESLVARLLAEVPLR